MKNIFRMFAMLLPMLAGAQTNYHIIVVMGQSLALGTAGGTGLSTTQPYSNVLTKASTGGCTGFTALVESTLESPSSGTANTIDSLVGSGAFVSSVDDEGRNGTEYQGIKPGTGAYNGAKTDATCAHTTAIGAGNTTDCKGIVWVHGEQDTVQNTTGATYYNDLIEMQSSWQTDCNTIAGSTGVVPLYLTQNSSWTAFNLATPTTNTGKYGVPLGMWYVYRDHPDLFYMVGPKYQFYAKQSDLINGSASSVPGYGSSAYPDGGFHLVNVAYRLMGSYYGKAIKKVAVDGGRWVPLCPRTITRSGATVTVKLWVPAGSVVIDTTILAAHGTSAGFEYSDNGTDVPVDAVATSGTDTLLLTLHTTPSGAGEQRLRYAYTGTPQATTIAQGVAYGNIRDTDTAVGINGDHLYDWLVTFDEPMGFAFDPTPAPSSQVSANTKIATGVKLQ